MNWAAAALIALLCVVLPGCESEAQRQERELHELISAIESAPDPRRDLSLELTTCGTIRDFGAGVRTRGLIGRVTNNGASVVDVFIETDYLDADGVIVSQGNAWVSSLAPGSTAQWESPALNDRFDSCEARIENAFPVGR